MPDLTTPDTTVPTNGTWIATISILSKSIKSGATSYRECVIDVKFERSVYVVVAVVRDDVEEGANEIQRVTCYVGDLEDWTDALTDELGGRVYTFLLVFDENWNLSRARRL
jgi:hypothetical protein